MRWPIQFRIGGHPTTPPTPPSPDRPTTVIGFLSDLSRSPQQALTFVLMIGGISFIVTVCLIGALLAVSYAAKGTKGIPLHYIWPIGVGGATVVTFVTTLVTTWIRRSVRASRADAADDRTQDDKRLGIETPTQCPQPPHQHLLLQPTTLAAVFLGPRG